MNRNTQQVLVWGGLVATIIAAVFAPKSDQASVVEVRAKSGTSTMTSIPPQATATSGSLVVATLQPRRGGQEPVLFRVPPPPRPAFSLPQHLPPAPPPEPSLPNYSVIGRYDTGSRKSLLLRNGNDLVEANVGDTVGNGWRIAAISEDGIEFVSPTGHKQLLPVEDNH